MILKKIPQHKKFKSESHQLKFRKNSSNRTKNSKNLKPKKMKSEKLNHSELLNNLFSPKHMKSPERAFFVNLQLIQKATTLFSSAVLVKNLASYESPASALLLSRILMEKLSSTRQIESSLGQASVK